MSDEERVHGADRAPTGQELAAAAALAAALEGQPLPGGGAAPAEAEEALGVAALLGLSRQGDELAPEREQAVLRQVLARSAGLGAWPPERAPQPCWTGRLRAVQLPAPGGAPWRWLAPLGGLAVAAALVLVLAAPDGAPTAGTVLPAPDAALLGAQARAIGGGPQQVAALEAEMDRYREQVYGALARRYGTGP